AGPTANAVIAGVIFALLVTQPTSYLYLPQSVTAPFYAPAAGVMIAGVVPGSPAQRIGLSQGDVILSINGTPLRGVGDLAALNLSAGESLMLQVERAGRVHTYNVNVANISGKAMIGVYLANNMEPKLQLPYLGASVDYFLLWLLVISFAVAAFNMLPMAPFDGAIFMDALLSPIIKDDSIKRVILYTFYTISAILLMGNIALSLVRFGVPSF
ncbi:MAG TPA: RIP metalloprotease, partial [Nitrososphaeria archaeon]|nr:RIP metalloprotease [Nitrososphaeria archaeon]